MKKTILFVLVLMLSFQIIRAEAIVKSDWFTHDKFSHFTTSTFLYCWNYKVLHNGCNLNRSSSSTISFSFVSLIGLGKEIIDSRQPNNKFSYKDLIYDLSGNFLGLIICK